MALLFSIVIPTYNRQKALLDIVELVRRQQSNDWELIIIDDSQDSNVAVLEVIADNRIHYVYRGEKLGVSSARNLGAKHAQGRYLVFIDDDDRISETWLEDFARLAEHDHYPEILYCGMEIVDTVQHKRETFRPSAGHDLWRFIFPGSWAITKTFFDSLGGYDERLLFGENTELFFRIRAEAPRQAMTDAVNFYYYPSVDGGSKNIRNRIDSTIIILDKHKKYFSRNKRVKRLFTQLVGVSLLRLNRFREAQSYLLKAYLLNPFKLKALLRLCISYMPVISRRIYS